MTHATFSAALVCQAADLAVVALEAAMALGETGADRRMKRLRTLREMAATVAVDDAVRPATITLAIDDFALIEEHV